LFYEPKGFSNTPNMPNTLAVLDFFILRKTKGRALYLGFVVIFEKGAPQYFGHFLF
jgi:hypothetical protein